VAILLVVLFHVGIPWFRGGFVGVDVFFVISGFVITGLLLRERQATNATSFLSFYGRRARRILPAALLVVVVALVGSAIVSGRNYADLIAADARWTVVFLANIHIAHVYPNYLVNRPQSPLQQYWSLAVEEQFYLVFPACFAGVIALSRRRNWRRNLAICLAAAAALSFGYSVVATHSGQLGAYDSTLTRVWELAAGALVALGVSWFERIPPQLAAALTWFGLAGILVAAAAFSVRTAFPGWVVALPVLSTVLVVGCGASARGGAEVGLGLKPVMWVGQRSYGWYLWHWPLLVLCAQAAHTTVNRLGIAKNLTIVVIALALAVAMYAWFESPIRHLTKLVDNPTATLIGAGALIATCYAFTLAF
jgi:peptidoglycan/LPS O-acetylase OafA/YrhL